MLFSIKSPLSNLFLITLFSLSIYAYADEIKTTNIVNDRDEVIGFIDQNGQYHELQEPASSSCPTDSGRNRIYPFSTMDIESTTVTSSASKTIDKMTFSNSYYYTFNSDRLALVGDPDEYYLNDGSNWNSGAGGFSGSSAYYDHVEIDGNTLHFYFKNPYDFQWSDYNHGDHSTQGELRPLTPLVIEANVGSTTGKLFGTLEIVSNDMTNYGESRFNFFSAPIGAVVPFETTYTLLSGATFSKDLFSTTFKYNFNGFVDFANPVSVPLPVSLKIKGAQRVLENSSIQYVAVATFDNDAIINVTETTQWNAIPISLATVNQGLVTTSSLSSESEIITLSASYTYDGVTLEDQIEIECIPEGAIYPDNAWPMFQGNKEHTGYVSISLNPAVFSEKWEHDFGRSLNPVAAADGKVFVSTPSRFQDQNSLFTLDDRDGELLWSKNLGTASSVNPPSYGYGNVYIQTGKGTSSPPPYVSAFDAETGNEVFRAQYSAQWESYYAPTIFKGNIYVNGGYYGGMYCYDAFDGTQKWFISLSQYDDWTPAVDENYAYSYVGGLLSIVDRLTGQLDSSIQDPDFDWHGSSMNLAPVIGNNQNILVILDGRLVSFDLTARKIGWVISDNFSDQPSVAEETIYAINDGHLEARSEMTGDLLWQWTPPAGSLRGTIVVTDSHILTHTENTTYAVEILSRSQEWSHPKAGHLAIANDTLYIASSDGILTAISIPEYIPSKPIELIIEGPDEIEENSTTDFIAVVHYEDGRQRNRSDLSVWSLNSQASASVDDYGSVTVGELLYPEQKIILNAEYTEGEHTLSVQKEITVRIVGTVDDLIKRNIEGTVKIKQGICLELEQALAREEATLKIIQQLRGKPKNDPYSNKDINKARNQIALAILRQHQAKQDIISSLLNLGTTLEVLVPDSPYVDDLHQFEDLSGMHNSQQIQEGDVNGDGIINLLDLMVLTDNWLNKTENTE